jgi:NAD-dependent SIR2 family protein deacetylase
MQFVINGPDIPRELVSAQEKGETIFVCGAGVSVGAGLPLFRGLVEGIYQRLGEDWNLHPAEREGMRDRGALEGQYDRVLRCLERRLAASDAPRNRRMRERIRSAVRQELKPPENADLTDHLALLELSRDAEGRNRILTTNFDTLFERAWYGKYGAAIASHSGAAMPQPKVAGCTGILHLHGRLADPRPELQAFETDLVLTSAEFGDAYLRSGWASRYVYDLVRAYSVVLVGYQADDPPMRYLLEALEADRERYPDLQKVYAFASCEPGNEGLVQALWAAKGVEPILYFASGPDHSSLYERCARMAALCRGSNCLATRAATPNPVEGARGYR